MKKNIRLIALILTLIAAFSLLAGCNGETNETTAPAVTDAPDTAADETTAAVEAATSFDFVVNGETKFSIIRPQDLPSSDPSVAAAVKIRNELESALGIKLSMADDFKKSTEEYDHTTYEILVGTTKYPQLDEAIVGLKYGDYAVKQVGNKIVVFGFTPEAMDHAADLFIEIVKSCATTDGAVNVNIPFESLNVADTHEEVAKLSYFPVYDGASYYCTSDSDISGTQLVLSDADLEGYNAYLAELEKMGFTTYTTNNISGNLFATLYNSEYTLNIGYYEKLEQCRIIMEPFTAKTLIGLESDNNRPTVTTSQVTMIGCEYQASDGSYKGNGLSLLFRLSDGSFVVVDGGHTTKSAIFADNLIKAIKEQAKDYATGKDIRIAAWFITHAHGDHMGMFRVEAAKFNQFTVERVVANLMSESELQRSLNSSNGSNFGSSDATNTEYVRQAAAVLGAEMVVCHTGQRYYIGDTVFEILYTVENFAPSITNALNTSSLFFRAVTTDKSGNTSTVMVMGDVTGPAMAICNKIYGKDMRAQVVQVAHHGYQTWGNDAAMKSTYGYMSPEIVLWPMGLNAYPTYKEKAYNKVLWDGTNKNLQQVFVAGWSGSEYIVPLPYNGDPNSVIAKVTTQS